MESSDGQSNSQQFTSSKKRSLYVKKQNQQSKNIGIQTIGKLKTSLNKDVMKQRSRLQQASKVETQELQDQKIRQAYISNIKDAQNRRNSQNAQNPQPIVGQRKISMLSQSDKKSLVNQDSSILEYSRSEINQQSNIHDIAQAQKFQQFKSEILSKVNTPPRKSSLSRKSTPIRNQQAFGKSTQIHTKQTEKVNQENAQMKVNMNIQSLQDNNGSEKNKQQNKQQIIDDVISQSPSKVMSKKSNKTVKTSVVKLTQNDSKKGNNSLNVNINPILEEEQDDRKNDLTFDQLLKRSQNRIGNSSVQLIASQMKRIERRVQRSFVLPDNQYLECMMNEMLLKNSTSSYGGISIEGMFDTIGKAMKKRSENVEASLQKGQLVIQKQKQIRNKQQINVLQKIDTARLIQIKDGNIRSKVDIINQKINQIFQLENAVSENKLIELQQKFKDSVPDAMNFGLDSQKTMIAKQYIKHLSEQRKLKNQKKKQLQQIEQKKQKQRQTQLQQANHMRKLANKQKFIQKMKNYKEKKLSQHQHHSQQIEKIKNILDPYTKSPRLFRKKQKQFEQMHVKPMQRYRQIRLNQIRQQRKKSNTKAIEQHEQKYLKAKQQNQKKLEEKRLLQRKQFEKFHEIDKAYFRGRSHQRMMLQDERQRKRAQSMLQMGRDKVTRMQAYQRLITKQHKPQIDAKKRQQINNKIIKQKLKNKKVKIVYKQVRQPTQNDPGLQMSYQQIKPKNLQQEGNRNLQFSKKRIAKMKKRQNSGFASQQQIVQQKNSAKSRAQSQPKIKGQNQKLLWSLRKKNFGQQVHSPKQFETVKIKMEMLDQKAENKEKFIRMGSLSWDAKISQQAALDEYYFNCIAQKVRLLEL